MRYTAGWNMPGYLPETDPEMFTTWDEAVEYIKEIVDRFFEDDMDSVTWAPESEQPRIARDIRINWNAVRGGIARVKEEPRFSFMAMTVAGDLCFWIVPFDEMIEGRANKEKANV